MWFRSISPSAHDSAATRSRKARKRRNRLPAPRLQLEALEGRCLLTFMAPVDYAVGHVPRSVAVADFTNNGVQDLVTCNNVDSTVSILLGNGDGTFQAPLTFTLPNIRDFVSVAVGDMNHDGLPDLVVGGDTSTSPTNGLVDVLLGHGDGTFSLASATNVSGDAIRSVKLADFNGDGSLDVATETWYGSHVAVLLGNGNGTLAAPAYYATGTNPVSLTVGDVNGDGKLDLATANYTGGSLSVLLGNGDGTFQPSVNVPLPTVSSGGVACQQHPQAVVMGDLNGDGKMDLAVSGGYSYTAPVTYYYNGTPYQIYETVTQHAVNALLGNGDGTFTLAQTALINGSNPYSITAGNFNSDGFPDLAVADAWANTVSVLLNGANWAPPAPAPSSFSLSGFPTSTQAGTPGTFAVTALNADGTVDTGYTGTVRFNSSDAQAALPAAYTFTAADAGKHTFSATLKTAGTQSITATDASTGTISGSETGIAVTPASASHFAVSSPAGSTAGSAFSVIVTALDSYNNVANGYAGTVHFTSSDGLAGLPADYTFTANDAGVHTFTSAVTLKTAGSQTVAATDASTGSIMGSTTVSVSPATASTMIVTGFPSPITAGVAGSFTVTLKDAYGNVASGYTGTVHFTSSDAKAVLPANYTFASGDAGKHTFSATLKTAGTQWISATDTVNASLHGTDSGITVKPAAASKFVLSAPASVQPGVPFSLTVTVEDAYGNIVTGYAGTIHFSSGDSKAKLPANYTFTAGNNGMHTFSGVVLRKAGNQTIAATDTKNNSITGKTVVNVV